MKTKEPFVQKLVHKAAQGIVRRERYGWPPWLSICTAVRKSWTSTSVCCLARIRLRPLSLPQSSPQKILLPRMPQNKPNTEKRTRLVPASCGALFYTPH